MNAAWYGGALATISVAVGVYVAFRDRGRLIISIDRHAIIFGQEEHARELQYLGVTVVNGGRRPVTVTGVGVRAANGQLFLGNNSSPDPLELGEGKSSSYRIDHESITFATLRQVVVLDSIGRTWKKRIPNKIRLPLPSPKY